MDGWHHFKEIFWALWVDWAELCCNSDHSSEPRTNVVDQTRAMWQSMTTITCCCVWVTGGAWNNTQNWDVPCGETWLPSLSLASRNVKKKTYFTSSTTVLLIFSSYFTTNSTFQYLFSYTIIFSDRCTVIINLVKVTYIRCREKQSNKEWMKILCK